MLFRSSRVVFLFYYWQVREAQLAQYNYILVVGEEEANTGQVCIDACFFSASRKGDASGV